MISGERPDMAASVVLYRLRLVEPVLAGRPGGDANTVWSYPYLPGGAIRGAVLSAVGFDPALVTALVHEERATFLNAYLGVKDESRWLRSLPVPLTWRSQKQQGANDVIAVIAAAPGTETMEDTRSIRGFFADSSRKTFVTEPDLNLQVHHQRHSGLGRPVKSSPDDREPGTIFRFASLAANQRFSGAILIPDDTRTEVMRALEPVKAGATLRIGKARRSYGLAVIEEVTILPNWDESPSGAASAAKVFTLTLLSPALFRDGFGGRTLEPDSGELARLLGQPATVIGATTSAEPVGGFNRKWNLPLPSTIAAAAGSTYLVRCETPISSFAMLLREGLGERRVEGFGRVAVNLSAPTCVTRPPDIVEAAMPELVDHTPPNHTAELLELLKTRMKAHAHGEASNAE